jgi:hypothetical protein
MGPTGPELRSIVSLGKRPYVLGRAKEEREEALEALYVVSTPGGHVVAHSPAPGQKRGAEEHEPEQR